MTIVEQYKVFKLELAGTAAGNPYVEVELSARFDRADGQDSFEVHGFYKGNGCYGINFMPESAGVWNYTVSSNDPELDGAAGSFEAVPATGANHGRVLLAKDVLAHGAPFITCLLYTSPSPRD